MKTETMAANTDKGAMTWEKWLSKFTPTHIKNSGFRKEDLEEFVRLFFQRANDRYMRRIVESRELDVISEFANFTNQRKENEIKVRILEIKDSPDLPSEGTVALETCMADQRFIIDTIKLSIDEMDLKQEGSVHFSLPFQRDKSGKFMNISKKEDDNHRLESVSRFLLTGFQNEQHKERFLEHVRRHLETAAVAVRDYHKIRKGLQDTIISYDALAKASAVKGPKASQLKEANEVIEWLLDNNFIFVNLLSFSTPGKEPELIKESTLGIDFQSLGTGDPIILQAKEFLKSQSAASAVFHLSKSSLKSPIKSSGFMNMVFLRQFDKAGKATGGMVLMGMFTHKALTLQNSTIPYLKNRLERITSEDEVRPQSSSYNARVKAFNTIMIEYLFECDDTQLRRIIDSRLDHESQSEASAHIDIMSEEQSAYALLAIPLEAYSDYLMDNIKTILIDALGAHSVKVQLGGAKGRIVPLAFYFAGCTKLEKPRLPKLEKELIDLCTPWHTRLGAALSNSEGGASAKLYAKYAEAFPASYQQNVLIEETISDILHLEELQQSGKVQFDFLPSADGDSTKEVRLRLYRKESEGLLLSEILPILHNVGFRVLDEIPTLVTLPNQTRLHIDTFRLLTGSSLGEQDYIAVKKSLILGLEAIFNGKVPSDQMNRLMLRPGLAWEDVDILRSYMKYSIQLGSFIDSGSVDRILYRHGELTESLVKYFHARFNPALQGKDSSSPNELMEKARAIFLAGMEKIQDATEDRVFRMLFNLVESTLRTNAFRTDRLFHYLSFKFECAKLDVCPEPRPLFEIFVHHAEMEGVHLRSGRVARGGLRWSDRLDDYRTEIFGLMRTQSVKNVLIVPLGAKGGYVVKGNPKPGQDRKGYGDEMYKVLIRGLLDLTDNHVSGKEVRPQGVVCHDVFDPYLVVAADKGTAHQSDTANKLSAEYNFWLGDAFASGGSAGYDHKVEGITAKGAWVCIRNHFGKIGVDPEKDIIRVVGIGDLSGDVFGNGMLRSKTIKLVGAFNHAHIFLDPNPDCETSFKERQRMFDLPRSSWTDYDKKVISKGGGVYSRAEKSIPLSPEIQEMLGTKETQLNTEEVIKSLLTLNVDLLYNGGLGTYIKSSQEDNREVGDKSNDSVRIDGGNIRAKVVGEGGNLGATQKGRIEYAIKGGLINTDAIDNSGGVDCSDREVNLKILFGPLINKGKMTNDERNVILKSLTPEVLAKILDDSQDHALCLSLDEIRSQKDPYLFLRTKDFLADMKVMVPKREDLPTLEALQKRGLKKGFTRPELSKLMAFFKMYVKAELLVLDTAKFPLREEFLKSYFPKKVYDSYSENIGSHILIRELLATIWIGRIINYGGASIFTDLVMDSERSVQDVAFAYTAAERWMNAHDLKRKIMSFTKASLESKFQGIVAVEEGIKSAASWILHFLTGEKLYEKIGNGQDFSIMAKKYNSVFEDILKNLSAYSSPQVGTLHMSNDITKYEGFGFSSDIAREIACSAYWSKVFPAAYLAEKTGKSSDECAQAYLICGKVTGLHGILSRIAKQPSADLWEAQALRSLRASLRRTLLLLTERVLVVGVNEALKREPSLTQVGEEIARLHANPSDTVPVSLLVVMGEKLHKSVTRL